jgi:Hint domain
MSRTPINRARRNALKAATLVSAFLATSALHWQASAAPGNNGNGKGGCGVGQQTNGCGGLCFARGTQIRTRDGDRPIETLAAGDEVAVRSGGFAPIKAMVSHTVNSVSGKWVGKSNLPVLIRRGALGENSPNADLCLTAWHPVYVDGFLIPVGDLVNGTSIIFEAADGRDTLDFFQVELDSHDMLDAQGAFCETLYQAGTERCAPLLRLCGGRSKLRSHMRSVASLVVDRRQPIDIIRDQLEECGLGFARAA